MIIHPAITYHLSGRQVMIMNKKIDPALREWRKRLRDTRKCPDCGRIQRMPKSVGSECENTECDSYLYMWYGKLTWGNPNWG